MKCRYTVHTAPGTCPALDGEEQEAASMFEEDCPPRRSQRCPHPPDRLAYYQSQIVRPIIDSKYGCSMMYVLLLLLFVKFVFLLFSPIEIIASMMLMLVVLLLSTLPATRDMVAPVLGLVKKVDQVQSQKLRRNENMKFGMNEKVTHSFF